MTTAIIGTGGIGSVIARHLTSGGETVRLSSTDSESARRLAAQIGRSAVVAVDNRDALQGADAIVLVAAVFRVEFRRRGDRPPASRQARCRSQQSGWHRRTGQRLTHPAEGAILWRDDHASGCRRVRCWPWRLEPCQPISSSPLASGQPEPAVLFYVTDDDRAGEEVERLIRAAGFEPAKVGGLEESTRLEVGGDLHDVVVGLGEGRVLMDRSDRQSPDLPGSPRGRRPPPAFRRGRRSGFRSGLPSHA